MAVWRHNDTPLKMSEKNEQIQFKTKGNEENEEDLSQLSYTAFESQDFLSSTRRSFIPSTKSKKIKKVKIKIQEAVQFSSDEEFIKPNHMKKPNQRKKKDKALSDESKSSKRTPLTTKHNIDPYGPQQSIKHTGDKRSAKLKGLKTKLKVKSSNELNSKSNSGESTYPESSISQRQQSSSIQSSSESNLSNQRLTEHLKKVKSGVNKKSGKKYAGFRTFEFSSESDIENISEVNTPIDVVKLKERTRELISSKSSESNASGSFEGKHAARHKDLEFSLKEFVMNSDSEDKFAHYERTDKRSYVQDTPEVSDDLSDEFTSDSIVRKPLLYNGKRGKLQKNRLLKFDSVIPDSEDDVLVPNTETPDYDDDIQHDKFKIIIPCSQEDSSLDVSSGKSNEQFVTVVNALTMSSNEDTNNHPIPAKSVNIFGPGGEIQESNSVCIPETQLSQQSVEFRNGSEFPVCIPDSETTENKSAIRNTDMVHFHRTPNREDVITATASLEDSAQVQQERTPGLVSRLVNLVWAVSSPVHTIFGGNSTKEANVKPPSEKQLGNVACVPGNTGRPHEQNYLATAEREQISVQLFYTSDEESLDLKSSKDVTISRHVNSDMDKLFERLEKNLSKSCKKIKVNQSKSNKKGAVGKKSKIPSSISDSSSTPGGNKFYKMLDFSSEEESSDLKSCIVISHSQHRHPDMRNILKSVKKSKSEKCKTKGTPKPVGKKKKIPSSISESRSYDGGNCDKHKTIKNSGCLKTSLPQGENNNIQDSQEKVVLVPDTESTSTELENSPPQITIPDSEESNFDLHLSISPKNEGSEFPRAQNTDPENIGRIQHFSTSDVDEEYSFEIPLYNACQKPTTSKGLPWQGYTAYVESSTDEFTLDKANQNSVKQTAEISLQVSMMSLEEENNNRSENISDVFQREISLQVSLASPSTEVGHVMDDNSNDQNDIQNSMNLPDKKHNNDSPDTSINCAQQKSFSTQVSMHTSSLEKDYGGLADNICQSSGDSSDDEEVCDQQSNRLQVSMCIQGRSSQQLPRSNMEESIIDIGTDDDEDTSSDTNFGNDKSDDDSDFLPPVPKKKIPKKTKLPVPKGIKTRKEKKSGSKSSDENLKQPQATKTVLLCEKKESVTGLTEGIEDDYSLPDIPPPVSLPSSDSSGDEFDAYLESLRTPAKKRNDTAISMADFLVDDDVASDGNNSDADVNFYARLNNEEESSLRTRIGSKDVFFKTPRQKPYRSDSNPPQPGPNLAKGNSKTPRPNRLQQMKSTPEHARSNSTGHEPKLCSFLKSLGKEVPDAQRNPEARRFVTEFKKRKEELTEKLFKLFNDTIFENKLPEDMNIKWNSRLLSTAGFCAYKRDKTAENNRIVRVELSTKVCDSAERVRDTLIHELCHAAVWVVFGKSDGHGRYWQSFAQKATRTHLELPSISRCHVYDINHKFIYKCNKCGQQVGRHTKSLNVEKKICGVCHGRFEVHLNTPQGLTPQTQRTPRTPNKFAIFVKENYKIIKERNVNFKHGDVMKALSVEFSAKTKLTD